MGFVTLETFYTANIFYGFIVFMTWCNRVEKVCQLRNAVLIRLSLKKNFMAPFYGWGSAASRLEPLRGGSLPFTTQFPEDPSAHFIDLGRMKGYVDLGATQRI